MQTDVIIVGAGPTGLMLAAELRSAGVRPLVLERQPRPRDTPKAGGLGGQILELLRYRGLLDRFESACTDPIPAPRFPFGGIHVDLTSLDESPLHALPLPQQQLERLLGERAGELGVDIRRGHRVRDVTQDADAVTAQVQGPDGTYRVTARYLVGCDGARSGVRDMAGIPFPGTVYPEDRMSPRAGAAPPPAGLPRSGDAHHVRARRGRPAKPALPDRPGVGFLPRQPSHRRTDVRQAPTSRQRGRHHRSPASRR
ncbi:FAD-dependent monooxygenase [Nocardia sp. MDA0666]|uniref:FAD-dependent monooxygenase n=1 Tax=Nocardia sp. MDA0666 TaxID=2135448 RepID=UPI0018EC6896|nr:FAD-dependent monooxygenase [Nocardia sp. MDA0666]